MTRGRSASRKEASEAEVRLPQFFDDRADSICKVLVRDHLVSIGILPNVNSIKQNRAVQQGFSVFYKTESGCKSRGQRVCSRTTRLENNEVKSRSDDKGVVAMVNTVPQVGCVSQDSEPSEVRFTQSTRRHASIRENKGPSLDKYKSKFLISEVPTL